MGLKDSILDDLKLLGDFITVQLGQELIRQDHDATGDLIQSLEARVIKAGDGANLEVLFNIYGKWVDKGRKPKQRRVPISALIDWIIQKGLASGSKKIKSMAFAIQQNIWKEGIPTKKSRARGKKIGWFTDTINRLEDDIEGRITDAVGKEFEALIDNLARTTNMKLRRLE